MNKERYLVWKYWDSVLKRGEATLNNSSGFGFDDIIETSYYRFTGTAINNPVTNAFGIIETVRFGGYIKQTLTFQTANSGAGAKVRQLVRMARSANPVTWGAWREVTLTDLA